MLNIFNFIVKHIEGGSVDDKLQLVIVNSNGVHILVVLELDFLELDLFFLQREVHHFQLVVLFFVVLEEREVRCVFSLECMELSDEVKVL